MPFTLLSFVGLKITQNKIGFNELLIGSFLSGLLFGTLIGTVRSGTPAIKHFILRLILWVSGYMPWNYAKFLNYCTDRLFLQRVGGGYRFIHDLLRQHFAKSYSQKTLVPVQESLVQPSPPKVQSRLVCTNCDRHNFANKNFCIKCGTKLNQPHI